KIIDIVNKVENIIKNTEKLKNAEIISNEYHNSKINKEDCVDIVTCNDLWNGNKDKELYLNILQIDCLSKQRDFNCICSLLRKINNILLCDIVFINNIEISES